ncbi:MAG: S49 family peptidase [Candidatus Babeliaceae bacterium]
MHIHQVFKVFIFFPLILFAHITYSRFSLFSPFQHVVNYCRKKQAQKPQPLTKVALLHIIGRIDDAEPFVKQILKCYDPAIKGIILHINSIGGGASSSIIALELKKLKALKPIVAIIEDVCFSAAYEIACVADVIIAPYGSFIGNIGVRFHKSTVSDASFKDENEHTSGKIHWIFVAAGKFTPYIFDDFCEKYREHHQNKIAKLYREFYCFVAQERNLSLYNVKEWANGKYFVATRALELHLIDKIGGYYDTLDTMKELLQQKDDDPITDLDIIEI